MVNRQKSLVAKHPLNDSYIHIYSLKKPIHNFKMSVEKEALCDADVCKDQKLPLFVLQEQKLKPTHGIGISVNLLVPPVCLHILITISHNTKVDPKNEDIVYFYIFLLSLCMYVYYILVFFAGLYEDAGSKSRTDRKFFTEGPWPLISWITCHNLVSVNDIWSFF